MFLERIHVAIHLMLAFTVDILERVSTELSFICLKPWRVNFEIHLATPYYVPMMFNFVRTIALNVFGTM